MTHVRRKDNGDAIDTVNYQIPQHKNAGNQKVKFKRTYSPGGAIGTHSNYNGPIEAGIKAGGLRDPNTGRQVAFQRVEGKIKGVVKRDGCVVYA